MDLPSTLHHQLPAELKCEIFNYFNTATQRKFVWQLGWDVYALFRHRLLKKVFLNSNK
jgi:hypothetical protein